MKDYLQENQGTEHEKELLLKGLFYEDQHEEVLDLLKENKDSPYFQEAHFDGIRGYSSFAVGKFEDAIGYLETYLRSEQTTDRQVSVAHYQKGLCHYELGEYQEAVDCFNLCNEEEGESLKLNAKAEL